MFSFPEKVVFRETEVGKKLELLLFLCVWGDVGRYFFFCSLNDPDSATHRTAEKNRWKGDSPSSPFCFFVGEAKMEEERGKEGVR